ncbi:MAG: hypothetical protein ACLPVY_17625 [Acidimicrobiia bacterium]
MLVLGSGCSSAKKAVAPPVTATPVAVSPANPPTTTTAAVTTTAPVSNGESSLATLILDTVPSGYTRDPDDVGQTGPTDITKAALDDVSPTARHALVVTGFVGGYQRQWTSSDGYTIDQDFLYQFQTAEGAQGYAQHWRETLLATNQGVSLGSFTPGFIPGAFGLEGKDSTGSTAVVMFAQGDYAVEATVNGGSALIGTPPVDQSEAATALASAQYSRLP